MKTTVLSAATTALLGLWLSSCATPLKTEQIRAKIEPGVSAADTLMTLGMSDSQQLLQPNRRVLIYNKTGIYFLDDKLVYIFNTDEQPVSMLPEVETRLAEQWKAIPENRNKVAFGENQKPPVNAYRAFYYLNDEVSFREAIRNQINPEGHSSDLNALCLSIRGGFTAAFKELLAINVPTDALINDHRAGKSLIRVSDCVWLQTDKQLASQYSDMIKAHEKSLAEKQPETSRAGVQQAPAPTAVVDAEKKKSGINWDEVKDWLKPQVPNAPDHRGSTPDESKANETGEEKK